MRKLPVRVSPMMTDFFFKLRQAGIPVSLTEFLTLLEALNQRVTAHSIEEFYYLARAALVKDERHYDRFDQVFGSALQGSGDLVRRDDRRHGAAGMAASAGGTDPER
jgi:uncharacterized protein with von Willebrand factor type A (vWA) domain